MARDDVEAVVGEEFSVRLSSIPTTGYVWQVDALPKGVELLGSAFEKATRTTKPGDEAIQTLRFRALEAGDYEIAFSLRRTWQKEAMESRTKRIIIHP
ncbi:MAG: protease inhibitor I42 family protein [Thermotogota bacterium]